MNFLGDISLGRFALHRQAHVSLEAFVPLGGCSYSKSTCKQINGPLLFKDKFNKLYNFLD